MRYARKPVSQVRTLNYSLTAETHLEVTDSREVSHSDSHQTPEWEDLSWEQELLPEQH